MKQPINRLLAGLLAVLMLAGCTPMADPDAQLPDGAEEQPAQSEAEQPVVAGELRVAYDSAENLNPYTTGSLQNYYLTQLLYDPLFRLDENYEAEPCLAQSMSMAVDQTAPGEEAYAGAMVTIRLQPGILFWDDSELTAADVVYSMQQAMQSSYYAAGLAHVSWIEADWEDPLLLTVGLSRPDAFFKKSLTFPVVKNGTGSYNRPVGCGRFEPAELEKFVPNTRHRTPVESFETVVLVDIPDMSSVGYSIKTGIIDLAVSDLRTPWNRSLGIGYTSQQLNNMVYLGVNKNGLALRDAGLRQVVYRLLNRTELDNGVYLGEDTTCWMPFNPAVEEIGSAPAILPSQLNNTAAGQLLDSLGYDKRDQNGYRTSGGVGITLTILVNEENTERATLAEAVAQSLEKVGLRAAVEKCSFEEYQTRVAEGRYDLFVGEVKLPPNLNMLPMITGADATGSGAWGSAELQAAMADFLRTGNNYDDAVELFAQEVPFIPLFFRQGIVAYPLNFCSNIIATEQDIFYNIKDWKLS